MTQLPLSEETLKQAVKDALAETLQEQRELLHDIFSEVLEDVAFAEAIREGKQTESVSRKDIDQLFKETE